MDLASGYRDFGLVLLGTVLKGVSVEGFSGFKLEDDFAEKRPP